MKPWGCLAVAVVVVVGVAGAFVGVLVWSLHLDEDQSSLTRRVQAAVVGHEELYGSGYRTTYGVDFTYDHDGRWYRDDYRITREYWEPGDLELTLCIDPQRPRRHVVVIHGDLCGERFIDGDSISEATPTTAPSGGLTATATPSPRG